MAVRIKSGDNYYLAEECGAEAHEEGAIRLDCAAAYVFSG